MGPVSATIIVEAPRERVFELISDLAARPAFTDHFTSELHLEQVRTNGPGAAARFRVDAPGNRYWMETVIDGADPPRRIEEVGRGGRADRIPMLTTWELAPEPGRTSWDLVERPDGAAWEEVEGPDSTTEVKVTFRTEPSRLADRAKEVLAPGGRRWHRRQWKRALRRLKDAVEGGEPVERVRLAGGDRVPS